MAYFEKSNDLQKIVLTKNLLVGNPVGAYHSIITGFFRFDRVFMEERLLDANLPLNTEGRWR
jgi:hypothetical protein